MGRLSCHVAGGEDREGGGRGPVLVLLHGFGAPGTDLVSLHRQIVVDPSVRFVFPMAPLVLEQGPSDETTPRAWWPIDIAALSQAVLTGNADDLMRREPDGLAEARAEVSLFLDAIEAELDPTEVVLGGFSQGAMLATDTVLRSDRKVAGLVILSGSLLAEPIWRARAAEHAGLPVLQSHGKTDPILPYFVAEKLRDTLLSAGLEVEWISFNGGHGIPAGAVDRLGPFVETAAQRSKPART